MVFRKRILLLEDDTSTQLLLKSMLLKIDPGLILITAHSAEAAYLILNEAKWDGIRIDLVVADVNLPGSSGLILWEVVMKRFQVDFLFISGMTFEKWQQKTSKLKTVPYFLPKPITEAELREFWGK